MTIDPHYEEDSLIVEITITENGSPKDITGATVLGAVRSPSGAITAAPNVVASITDASNGVMRVTVAKDVFEGEGSWIIQARVELGAESRTVYSEDVVIHPSLIQDSP